MPIMAKNQPDQARDRHKSTRMVRLPPVLHDAIKELARRNHRSATGAIILAREIHPRANGVEPPPLP
jgi:hypothetical protein